MSDSEARPGRAMWKRFALAGVVIVTLTATATATAALLTVRNIADALKAGARALDVGGIVAPTAPGEPQTLLVLGSDRRRYGRDVRRGIAGKPRSDTMILVRVDPSRRASSLMSIPRDLKAEIPTSDGTVTDRVNAAYEIGGAALSLRVVKDLLGIPINHVVDVNFRGFQRAVDRIGCVFADVDRRYYNHNDGSPQTNFSDIDLQPGYQRLCGQDALAYVRFRHADSDLVRAARQQDFLRQAKQQVGASRLFNDRSALFHIFSDSAQTDIASSKQILRLIELGVASVGHPVREVHFPARIPSDRKDPYVYASRAAINRAVAVFLGDPPAARRASSATSRAARPARRGRASRLVPGLVASRAAAEPAAAIVARARMPVFYPTVAAADGVTLAPARAYPLRDARGRMQRAYRIVVRLGAPALGRYYGLQGTTWTDPPILQGARETVTVKGRRLVLMRDGSRVRLVAWRTPGAVYWVSNDLLETLSERQMIGLAASLRRAE